MPLSTPNGPFLLNVEHEGIAILRAAVHPVDENGKVLEKIPIGNFNREALIFLLVAVKRALANIEFKS